MRAVRGSPEQLNASAAVVPTASHRRSEPIRASKRAALGRRRALPKHGDHVVDCRKLWLRLLRSWRHGFQSSLSRTRSEQASRFCGPCRHLWFSPVGKAEQQRDPIHVAWREPFFGRGQFSGSRSACSFCHASTDRRANSSIAKSLCITRESFNAGRRPHLRRRRKGHGNPSCTAHRGFMTIVHLVLPA